MNFSPTPKMIDANLWLMNFPLKMLGVDLQRNVTLIRLSSGQLVVHSTAPFSESDIQAIRELGEPAWVVDVLLRHDTFAMEGHWAFPLARYLAPEGFSKDLDFATEPMFPVPAEWADELEAVPIEGAPDFREIVMLHKPSRTLIVGDLVIHFPGEHNLWTKCLLHLSCVGGHHDPGLTKPFKMAIKDKIAYAESIRKVLEWDFDRVIVGHGDVIESGGKEKIRQCLLAAGIPGL